MNDPGLAPLINHGVHFTVRGTQGQADCPFCLRKDKFYANRKTGAWDCKVCGLEGGVQKFLELKSEKNQEAFRGKPAIALKDKRNLKLKTLRAWGVGWDGSNYTIPVQASGKLTDLRRYSSTKILSTTGSKIGFSGIINPNAKETWIMEGEWDGMAATEICKGRQISVLSVPGAGAIPANLASIVSQRVVVLFDKDDAGRKGAQRIHEALSGQADMLYLTFDDDLKEGYDLSDLLQDKGAVKAYSYIQEHLAPMPAGYQPDPKTVIRQPTGKGLPAAKVLKKYREWLHLPFPEIIDLLFGVVFANRIDGDPVWLFLVGPPGSAKTELIQSLRKAPLIKTTTDFTPKALISGAQFGDGKDPSLIPQLDGHVLTIKDLTTILKMNERDRAAIFGILRDAYDGRFERYYGSGVHRVIESRFGILAGVTNAIEAYRSDTILGERFLRYRIPQPVRIGGSEVMITRALNNINKETKMRDDLVKVAAQALDYKMPKLPRIPMPIKKNIIRLAQWISVLRGAVERDFHERVLFKPSTEVGTRLAKQLAKLALGISIFRREKEISSGTYKILLQVARSTVPDQTDAIVQFLTLDSPNGAEATQISKAARIPMKTIGLLLEDLSLLNTIKRSKKLWILSAPLKKLMKPLNIYSKEAAWHAVKRKARRKK